MANDFSHDSHCVALYRFEAGAVGVDSKGLNDLTTGYLGSSGAHYREGATSGAFIGQATMHVHRDDAALSSDFPFQSSTSNRTLSACLWFRIPSAWFPNLFWDNYDDEILFGKDEIWPDANEPCFSLHISPTAIWLRIGSGPLDAQQELLALNFAFAEDMWYHVGVTFEDASGAWRIRLYDLSTGHIHEATGMAATHTALNNRPFRVGSGNLFAHTLIAYLDELVIFNDVLSAAEIDLIRNGLYPTPPWMGAIVTRARLTGELSARTMAPVFPTWALPIREIMRFHTDIRRPAFRLPEERAALANGIPDQEFQVIIPFKDAAEARTFEAVADRWLKKPWGIPVWPQRVFHDTDLPAGATELALDTTEADFRAASAALLWQDGRYEIVDVATVAAAGLTLTNPLVAGWSGRKCVLPLRTGFLAGPIVRRRDVGDRAQVEATFVVSELAAITGHTAELTYEGVEVLIRRLYQEAATQDETHDPDLALLDDPIAMPTFITNSVFNEVTQPCRWHCRTAAEAWWLRQALHAWKGPATAVLVPTWRRDFVLTRPAAASATVLYVANRGRAVHLSADSLRQHIGFDGDGTLRWTADQRSKLLTPRRITAMAEVSAEEETITLNAALGRACRVGEAGCWLDLCRLASDEISWTWTRPGECDVSTPWVRVTN